MERVRNAFLSLLRAGLWSRDPLEEGFSRLGAEEWDEVFRMSGRQTVTGIVFDGICRLPEGLQPSGVSFARWVVAVDAMERRNATMNAALKDLVKLFVDSGLDPVLQKGQGIARLYPEPSHRECGDIDLYFSLRSLSQSKGPERMVTSTGSVTGMKDPERTVTSTGSVTGVKNEEGNGRGGLVSLSNHSDRALELIEAKGIKVSRMPDGSHSYEWKGIEVEHHPAIVDLNGPFLKRWIRTLTDDPGTKPSPLADGLLEPSTELNALLLNAHILKHAMGKGIGLRQMCDLAMVYHRMSESRGRQETGERIYCLYRRAWLQKWSRLLHSFLVDVIGLPEEELPYPERIVSVRPLLHIVEDGGNFGQYRSARFDRFVSLSNHSGRSASVPEPVKGQTRGKLATAGMFVRRAGFSLRFAPNEAFWTVVNLALGQLRSKRK